jgi:ferredoxin-NADP reductase
MGAKGRILARKSARRQRRNESLCVGREKREDPAMRLFLRSITYLARAINGYELIDPRGRDLPPFTAGAHVAVRYGGSSQPRAGAPHAIEDRVGCPASPRGDPGQWRDYSLWNDPAERRRYCIAILCERERGGLSRHLHETLRVGDEIEVSSPRNDFPLAETAERYLLLAGGIGITPLYSMLAVLRRRRARFALHYCTRSPEDTAFREELAILAAQGLVRFHHDGGDPARGLDIRALLREWRPGTHLYCCGPRGLMAAAVAAAAHWPAGTVHFEDFGGPVVAPPADDVPFRIRLAQSGREYEVAAGETIVEVLRRHGIAVKTSCELGYCGACLTPYRAGEPDHRDQFLDAEGRRRFVMICCTRARSPVLELDL